MYELNREIQKRNLIIDVNNIFIALVAILIIYLTFVSTIFLSILLLVYLLIFGSYSKVTFEEKAVNNQVKIFAEKDIKKAYNLVCDEVDYMENYVNSKNLMEKNILINLNHSNRLHTYKKYESIIHDVLFTGERL